MSEHQILFSGPMIKAMLAGTKTETRRICKTCYDKVGAPAEFVYPARESGWISWWPGVGSKIDFAEFTRRNYANGWRCPYGVPGDDLWARETWSFITLAQNERLPGDKWDPQINMPVRMLYKADADAQGWQLPGNWTPSIFMPRWASRLTLRVEAVRVERLQDITPADIAAEGLDAGDYGAYAGLWDKLNAKRGYPWSSSPWVWVIEFTKVEIA